MNERLLEKMIGLSRAWAGNEDLVMEETMPLLLEGLQNLNCPEREAEELLRRVAEEKNRFAPDCAACTVACGGKADGDLEAICSETNGPVAEKRELLKLICRQTEDLTALKREQFDRYMKALFWIGLEGLTAEDINSLKEELEE